MRIDRERARRRIDRNAACVARVAPLTMLALGFGLCAAGASAEGRRQVGERYAAAFSDTSRNRLVTWNDAACTFTERAHEGESSSAPAVLQVRVIPVARVTAAVLRRTARAGTLDVVFRCDPPTQHCIPRTRQYGTTVIGTDRLTEHSMPLGGSLADVARVSAELDRLHAACLAPSVDGGR